MSISENQIWMTIDDDAGVPEEGFVLPQNPESYQVQEGTNEKTVTIAGLGSVTVKNGKSPLTLSWSSFFSKDYGGMSEVDDDGLDAWGKEPMQPMEYDALIRKWKNQSPSKPVHVVITGTPVDAYFSISQYTSNEEGGDVGTIHYSLNMKQYGTASGLGGAGGNSLIRKIDIDPYDLPTAPDTYTVCKGDTLQTIAEYYYHDSQMVYEIYKLNSKKLKKGVNTKIKKGWVLYLPQRKA